MKEDENKNGEIDLIEAFKTIWAGRKTIFLISLAFAILGLIYCLFSPKEYSSSVTLVIENGTNDANSMSGLAQQIGGLAGISVGKDDNVDGLTSDLYPDVILSTPFLMKILDQKVLDRKTGNIIEII